MIEPAVVPAASDWIRVSRGTLPRVIGILAGVCAVIALAIAAPISALGTVVLGAPLPFLVAWVLGTAVVFLLIGAVLIPRSARSLEVSADGAALRLGRRVVPAHDVRHAYRIPDSVHDGRFQVRLAVPGGLDALVSVASTPPVELTGPALAALVRLIERSAIVPDPDVPVRPPVGSELGNRDAEQQFADRLGIELLPFETMSFERASLLAELATVPQGSAAVDVATDLERDVGLVTPGTTNAPAARATVAHAEAADAAAAGKRGFFGLMGSPYKAALAATEAWLQTASPGFVPARGALWGWGLALVVASLAWPWVGAAFLLNIYVLMAFGFVGTMAFTGFAVLTWPIFTWIGFMLMWRSRVARFERARAAALLVRRRGGDVPVAVAAFFGPPFPERAAASGLYLMLLADSVAALAGGLTIAAVGFGQVANWDGSWLAIAFGALAAASSAPLFFWALRIGTRASAEAVRSTVLWRAIAGDIR